MRHLHTAAELGVIRSGKSMPKYQIPKSPGEFRVITSRAGTPLICNDKSSKGGIKIPCRDQNHAQEIIEKIRAIVAEGGGEIWV